MQPAESQLLTIADWQQAVRDGADWRALLQARLARITGPGAAPHAWIHHSSPTRLDKRLRQLDSLAAATPARWPLLGVPFALKDNIDIEGSPPPPPAPPSPTPPAATPRWCSAC
jgi:allophanate hydrolase